MTRDDAERLVHVLDSLNRPWIWKLLRGHGEHPDRSWEAWAQMLREAAESGEEKADETHRGLTPPDR